MRQRTKFDSFAEWENREGVRVIGIITLPHTDHYNYGGVLQNYALCTYLNRIGCPAEAVHCSAYSVANKVRLGLYEKFNIHIRKEKMKLVICRENPQTVLRNQAFKRFIDEEIRPVKFKRYTKRTYDAINCRYNSLIVGSDQVWNPFWAVNKKTATTYFLEFFDGKKSSYAASFGTSNIPDDKKALFEKGLNNFDYISVRENAGAKIVRNLTGKNVEVVIDPTMLLQKSEWQLVEKRSIYRSKKPYILKYFLGVQSESIIQQVEDVARKLDCDIYDISENIENKFYISGPREFIDLIDHAQAIYTDSFHAMVFSVLFNKPYAVFERNQQGMASMSSRIETFLETFHLEKSYIKVFRDTVDLTHNFDEAYAILDKERDKAKKFLKMICAEETA